MRHLAPLLPLLLLLLLRRAAGCQLKPEEQKESASIGGATVTQEVDAILVNGTCVRVHKGSRPMSFKTALSQTAPPGPCRVCVDGECSAVRLMPATASCDARMGPDCQSHFHAKGQPGTECGEADPVLSSLLAAMGMPPAK